VAGVLLTKRDTFLTRAQYTQLLYAACCSSRPGAAAAAAVGSLRTPPPAIWRPQPLYTGKQVGSLTSKPYNTHMHSCPHVEV
jgi:DNA-directed RNA polymerase I subunit RPA1